MQREAGEHPSWLTVDHVDLFIARTISADLEGRDHIAELLLEPILRPEGQRPNSRMQPISADHQAVTALAGMFELNPNAVPLLFQWLLLDRRI